jgi:Tol biopolymer transport system component
VLATIAAGISLAAIAQPLQTVSVPDPSQMPAGGGGDSLAPIISPDGRYVLFASTANNLMLASNNVPIPALWPPKLNVYLRDRTNGTTTLVSVNLTGTGGGNGDSLPSGLSTNGCYALFESSASNLVPGDTNNAGDVFVRDLVNDRTLLVSAGSGGGVGNAASRSAVMTPDGRYVAFVSAASNLVAGDANGIPDVFVRDLQGGVTTLVSVGAMSGPVPSSYGIPYSSSESPAITPDGRYVAFYSTATNLVLGVTNVGDIYLRDLVGGTTTWASGYARTAVHSALGGNDAVCFNLALSDDGQFVAYEARPVPLTSAASVGLILRYSQQSGSTAVVDANAAVSTGPYEDIRSLDMTPDGRFIAWVGNANGTTGANTGVKVWDAKTSTTTLASGDPSGNVSAGSLCDWPVLSLSGQFVAFLSSATTLVTNALAGQYHLYVRDMLAAATTLVDADTNRIGSPLGSESVPAMSSDGRCVAFECPDGSLVVNDRNRTYDAFLRDLTAGATELISTHDPALPCLSPNASSFVTTLSVCTNARYVTFSSDADNLVPSDTNGFRGVFVRDLLLGTNILVSVGTNGVAADGPSTEPTISGDGRYVAFTSSADNLVAGDSNKAQDVFVCDLQSGATTLVSVKNGGGGPGNNSSYTPMISADGKYVLFRSLASNLASGSFSGENLFVRNLQSGATYALTTSGYDSVALSRGGRYVAFGGPSGNVNVWDTQAAATVYTKTTSQIGAVGVSPDGNRVVYSVNAQLYAVDRAANSSWTIGTVASGSYAGLRFSGDARFLVYSAPLSITNQVYLYDMQNRFGQLVSTNYTSGGAAYGVSDSPDISNDGRFVAYRSAAINLVPGGTNGVPEVFLHDQSSGITMLMSANRFCNAGGDNHSLAPVFSGDGQTVVFQSWASDLVGQDFNYGSDVFAYSLDSSGEIPVFSATVIPGSGRGPWVLWPVLPGRIYQVQYKNHLSDTTWQNLHGGISILGSQAYFNDLSAGAGPRFYRVTAY